ncbi:MAG TPA: class I SAM-dependent rRNA methyltransferase [Bacteroidales bacterium]|jgi:23S rRNA (cytosine1962-C5)-methyltransferase|nr:class I SAM-dependent rRNA methyltransferase [Bacteroidales bacterium]
MKTLSRITLKPGKEQSVKRMHPWIFSGAIKKIDGEPAEGDPVYVFSNTGEFLASGHYQIGSIAVRIFAFHEIVPDADYWKTKITDAFSVRNTLNLTVNENTNIYRLINGEGDGMPGLIIDYYNGIVVMQMHSIGMYLIRQTLVEILTELYGKQLKAIYDKSESTLPYKANLGAKNEFLFGNEGKVEVIENGHRFLIDICTGQKTGFFIDQRDNRQLLTRYVTGKNVLNMFSYTGGFSVYALGAGASDVHSVDSSGQAMEITGKNVELNGFNENKHQSFVTDAFAFMNNIPDKYDVIILDPPAFAKHLDALGNALIAYKRINARAIEQIRNGGILFTFSCSQVVSRENFRKSVFAASANTGRHVRILHQLTQPPDHPVSIYHPEGEYLKGLVLEIS